MRWSRPRRHGAAFRSSPALRLSVAGGVSALLLLGGALDASADPSIDDKRAQAQAILEEITTIDEEVGAAAERYNGANYELGRLTVRLRETRRDLQRARRFTRVAQRRVAQRLHDLYLSDDSTSTVELILGARSLTDVIDRMDVAGRVAAQDAQLAEEATALRTRVAKREQQLRVARRRQVVVVAQREAEKRVIESRLAERQRLLGSIRGEIARLEAVERRRQAELRRQARIELERQARAAKAQRPSPVQEEAALADESAISPSSTPSGYTPPPADAGRGAQVVAIAMKYLGVPYKWGGASPSEGFDCSGLTMYVYAQIGISLPHYAAAQYTMGVPVAKEDLEPGDLVFFRSLGHMGMYIGGGNFIQAPRTGDVVKISPLSDPYYAATYVGARRVL